MIRVALPPTWRPWRRVIDSAVTPGRRSSAKITGSLSGSSVRRRSSISRTAAAMVPLSPASTAPSTVDRPGVWPFGLTGSMSPPACVTDPVHGAARRRHSPRSALCRNLSLPYRTRTRTSHEVPPWGPACTARPIELKRFKME